MKKRDYCTSIIIKFWIEKRFQRYGKNTAIEKEQICRGHWTQIHIIIFDKEARKNLKTELENEQLHYHQDNATLK